MRLKSFIIESNSYNNWVRYTNESLKSDFSEYKKKENSKWRRRAKIIGAKFPFFGTIEDFKMTLNNAEVVNLTEAMDDRIGNRSHCSDIGCLKDLVSGYVRPRDVDRIVKGFETGAKIPMPIVIEGNHGTWIMAGNTRLDTAFIMGVKPKVLWVKLNGD